MIIYKIYIMGNVQSAQWQSTCLSCPKALGSIPHQNIPQKAHDKLINTDKMMYKVPSEST
jgi:hypothetical protein